MHRRLSFQALLLAGGSAIGQLIMALVIAVAGRSLGPSGLGVIAVSLSVAAFLNGVVDFGANFLLLREVASGRIARRSYAERTWSKLVVGAAIAVTLTLLGVIFPHAPFVGGGVAVMFLALFAPAVLALSLRVDERNSLLALAQLADRCCMAATFFALHLGFRVHAGMSLYVAYAAGALLDCLLAWCLASPDLRPRPSRLTFDAWKGSAYFGVGSVSLSLASLDVAVASLVGGQVAAGAYGAVNRWVAPIGLATNAFSTVLFPVAAKADSGRQAWHSVRRSMWLPALAILAAGAMALAAPILVPLVMGPRFVSSVAVLRWLCLGMAFSTGNQVVSTFLQARGRERGVGASLLAGVLIQLASLPFLVPRFGASGVAMAMCVSQLIFAAGFALTIGRDGLSMSHGLLRLERSAKSRRERGQKRRPS